MNPPKISSASASASENGYLLVTFDNGVVKKFSIKNVLDRPYYQDLSHYSFLKNFKVDKGGYAITWNENVDICENELWEKGELAV